MTSSQEYRQYAEECLRWAREAKSDAERRQYLDMANAWVQAAALQDGKLPVVPTRENPALEIGKH